MSKETAMKPTCPEVVDERGFGKFVWHVCTDEEIWPSRRLTDGEILANLEADAGVIHFSEDATSLPTGWLGQ